MLGISSLTLPWSAPVQALTTRVRDWPVAAQQHARRNAMIAATDCAQRRIEREEVADFLSELTRRRTTPKAVAPTVPVSRAAHR